MDALFTFRIGFSTRRPIRPDEEFSIITLLGEDSAAGHREAERAAIAWAMAANRAPMATSSELIACEI